MAARNQLGEARLVQSETLRLAYLGIGDQPQPGQIRPDRIHIAFLAALGIGIVDAQQETPASLLRIHPVVQRGADIADMQPPGGRGSETGHGHERRHNRGITFALL